MKSKNRSKNSKKTDLKDVKGNVLPDTVLSIIELDRKAFFRKLKRFFRQEMIFTKTFSKWEKQKMSHRIKHLKALKKYPGEIAAIANIIKVFDKYYEPEKYSYGNKTVVETAFIIYELYGKKIWTYMEKYLPKRASLDLFTYTAEEALAEQIARGFVKKDSIVLNFGEAYIKSNVDKNYVWPEQWVLNKTYENAEKIGVSGYTGIVLPKKYRK